MQPKQITIGEAGRRARTFRADARAAQLGPEIMGLRTAGLTSLHAIAKALNERGVPTATGKGRWEPSQVRRVLARLK
jgi:Recombinase